MFQQLLLVSEGQCVYFGPAAEAVDHFSAIDPAFACPALFNPAVSSLARVFAHSAARPLSLSFFFFF